MITVFQRRIPPVIAAMVAAVCAATIVAAVDARNGGGMYLRLALWPRQVWRGELWRLVTWCLVEGGPYSLALTCISIVWFGGDLHASWGARRFGRFVAAVVLVAGVGTSLVGLVDDSVRWSAHLGGWALADALLIAWALRFPLARVCWWGISLGGPALAYGTFGLTVLFCAFYGLRGFLPELLAGATALAIMTQPWRPWLRRARVRLGGLGVIAGERHGGPYRESN